MENKKQINYIGSKRDLTQIFNNEKQRLRSNYSPDFDPQRERYKPKSKLLSKIPSQNEISGNTTSSSTRFLPNASGQIQNQYKNQNDENYLPPVWIDIQEDIDDIIINVQNYFEELRPLRSQRFGQMMFDDEGAQKLDENISQLVIKITQLIKRAEMKLKEMRISEQDNQLTTVKLEVIRNVQQRYLVKLQTYTQQLKNVEKEYVKKMTDLYGEDYNQHHDDSPQLQQLQSSQKLKYSNEQIEKILNQMNGLSDLYKEMSRLVIEQGTIMDRIEQNTFDAHLKVNTAKIEIHKTFERETSSRANGCIICLIQSILICIAIIAFKHM